MKCFPSTGAVRWVVLLLAAFFLQGLVLIRSMSTTADEVPFHIVNGYTHLRAHDYRMTPANPALIREWLVLPWLFIQPKLDLTKESWRAADSQPFAYEFFYKDNRSIANLLLYSARFMNLLLGLLLGLVVFLWSRSLYGAWGGVLSLAFYAFCPNFLAHASIAHIDVGLTLFSVSAAFFLWRHLEYSKKSDLFGLSISFGLACAAKYNALYLGPIFLLILGMKKGFMAFLRATLLLTTVSFFVIWLSYGFEFKPILGGAVPRVEEKLSYVANISNALFPGNEKIKAALQKWSLETPVPIPSYILGVAAILRSHRSPYFHYAFGEWTTQTHWYYYFFSFAIKMTLPFLALLTLRMVYFKKASSSLGQENLVVLLPASLLFLMTCFDTTAVGVRYLFPVIPLLFVWVGGLARLASTSKRWAIALTAAVILNVALTMSAFPNYLSYFNSVADWLGGGFRYVRGSDVDWGQGLKALKRYMKDHELESLTLRYFGAADPSFYGIQSTPLTEEDKEAPTKKVYAISIFYLEHVSWSHKIKPKAVVGGSIFVYDFR